MAKNAPHKIYIDALSIVPQKKSGVGYTVDQIVKNLSFVTPGGRDYQVYLVVPLGKANYVKSYLNKNITIKTIYLPARVLEVFLRLNIMLPMDWILGRGVYLFPNYRNWSLWRSRSLTYVYDVVFKRFPETVQPKNRKYLQRYSRRWVSRTDKIITISDQVKYEIEKYLHVPETKIDRIYCGVDRTEFYKRDAKEVALVKEKYGVDCKSYFLFVGNIEPRKNLNNLLDAYAKLPPAILSEYPLVIVGGDGWLNEKLYEKMSMYQEAGLTIIKVKQYVETSDLPALYSGSVALVHPAIYEGFGITPLEAMACETQVVVSDIPAINEVVGSSGIYFEPTDPRTITTALQRAVKNNDRTENIKSGLERSKILSWASTARAIEELFDEQFEQGLQRRPLLKRLKSTYAFLDEKFRQLLGDKALPAYVPPVAHDEQELSSFVLDDFKKEQPNIVQRYVLKLYLLARHIAGKTAKTLIGLVR